MIFFKSESVVLLLLLMVESSAIFGASSIKHATFVEHVDPLDKNKSYHFR